MLEAPASAPTSDDVRVSYWQFELVRIALGVTVTDRGKLGRMHLRFGLAVF
ncbi:MAG: hypothetical protein JWM11_1219 [Planctomycetaceae bacterium]|nr:hypothetical protein [Planctomycetaceae bacterium]